MIALTTVVVTHKGGGLIRRCLEALLPQLSEGDDVRVVISGTGVRLPKMDRVTCVEMGRNVGFARAANAGFEGARGEAVVLLNDDTRPLPGFLDSLREAASVPGIYAPRILLSDGSGRLDNVGHGLFPDGFNWARGREDADAAEYNEVRDVGACSGAALLIHRGLLEELGGFDPDLEAFGEDVDLSLRARRLGYPLRSLPGARVEHDLGATYGRHGARKLYLVERNRVRVAVRSMPTTALLTMPVWTGLRVVGLALAASFGRGWGADVPTRSRMAALAGIAAGVAHIPGALAKRRQDAPRWVVGERDMWGHVLRNRVRLRDVIR
jgi:GT2 family glycosyltransferase